MVTVFSGRSESKATDWLVIVRGIQYRYKSENASAEVASRFTKKKIRIATALQISHQSFRQ